MTDLSNLTIVQLQSKRSSDRIAELVNAEVEKYGDGFSWDYSISIVPTPNGVQAMGLFVMFMKNPLLGTGDIAVIEMIPDLTLMTRADDVKDRVASVVRQLRDQHAANLQV